MSTARPRLVSTSLRKKIQPSSPVKRVKSCNEVEEPSSPPLPQSSEMAEPGGTGSGEDVTEEVLPEQQPPGKFTEADLQAIKLTSDTLKRNPKMDFSKTDLLKLLSYLEGELQARDVVIAVLKTEKVKQLLNTTRYSKSANLNDPHAALYRDNLASSGTIASRQSSIQAAYSEHEMRLLNDQRVGVKDQMDSLAALVMQQRQTQAKMVEVLKDAEERYKHVVQELEDERRKHEHTTAQGDDITYGLEIERSRLKQELEHEREQRKVLELEVKKIEEQFDAEKNRQKQIVLLLLAERKKIIIKYIEERKRSEDLAQILSEEKMRVDTIAEGLEEESKKSLRMEAELETQTQQYDLERKMLHQSLAKDERRIKEQEIEIQQLKTELDLLRKQTGIRHPIVAPQLPTKPGGLMPSRPSMGGIIPATGIARSVSPGQLIRQTAISQLSITSPPIGSGPGSNSAPVAPSPETYANATPGKMATVRKASSSPAGSPAGIGFSAGMGGTATTLKKTIIPPVGGRGVPPPIPPNKPQIPPKLSATSAAAAVAAAAVSSRIPFLSNSNHTGNSNSIINISNSLANSSTTIGSSLPSPSSVSSPLSSLSSPSPSSCSSSTNSASSTSVAPPGLTAVSGSVPPTNNLIASSTVANNATAGTTTAAAATNSPAVATASPAVAVSAAAAAASQNSPASAASAFVSTAAEILTNIGCEGGIV
ncbi:CTTNBP2 N-terminal-like protein isoform X2 [Wyeomyia smithii]|uniref:CTTNBP2 N-terminal-like protein isoform X2 n=1 Tax=Wyeomyia smithii TaxID=174621 RepID=UPI002467C137|nr:CTTNBP2 N-terminal-like protein isoform X2 [Wyeomyia smithii]